MGRRNLLTTASNGSANGLQEISDRLADNFSILPGHHGTGDNREDGDEDNGGGVNGDDDAGGGGGVMEAVYCQRVSPCLNVRWTERARCARATGGLSLSLPPSVPLSSVNQCWSTAPTPQVKVSQTLIWGSLTLMRSRSRARLLLVFSITSAR